MLGSLLDIFLINLTGSLTRWLLVKAMAALLSPSGDDDNSFDSKSWRVFEKNLLPCEDNYINALAP